jgi:hypothetical protein
VTVERCEERSLYVAWGDVPWIAFLGMLLVGLVVRGPRRASDGPDRRIG